MFAVALGLNLSAQVPDYVPTDGLVAWYPFNGNANDESGNGNDGVINGTVEFDESNALFNGIGYIETPVTFDFEQRTVCAEIIPDEVFNSQRIFASDNEGLAHGLTTLFYSAPECFQGLGLNQGSQFLCISPVVQTLQNVCLVRDIDSSFYYVNGVLTDVLPSTSIHSSSGNPTSIIGADRSGSRKFHGQIGFLGLWNQLLNSDQIAQIYNEQSVVYGCADPTACNFDSEATSDDGSCIPSGCMETDACNYNALAECEGEACDYSCCPGPGCCLEGTVWDAELGGCIPMGASCPEDLDFDGVVGVNDLMELLSAFGTDCPEPEEPETTEFSCGDPVNYHGYDYATLQIGEQCWFAENLRSVSYQNGDSIPTNLNDEDWSIVNYGACSFYVGPDWFEADTLLYQSIGMLYNRYVIEDIRNVCPSGWHVSTDSDWMVIELELGMSEVEQFGNRGVVEGIGQIMRHLLITPVGMGQMKADWGCCQDWGGERMEVGCTLASMRATSGHLTSQ